MENFFLGYGLPKAMDLINEYLNQNKENIAEDERINGKKLKNGLILKPFKYDEKYRKKWNVGRIDDYYQIYKNGVLVNDNVFRIGGMPSQNDSGYASILLQKESHYSKKVLELSKSKDGKYLNNIHVIINSEGKIVFTPNEDNLKYPILYDGIVCSFNDSYYNMVIGDVICECSGRLIKSTDYLFIENRYDDDKSKRGVIRISLRTGDLKLYK